MIFLIIALMVVLFPFYTMIRDFFNISDLSTVQDPKFLRVLWFTLYQALLSSVAAFFAAIVPSLYCAKNDNFISKLLENSIFIPFFFPPVSMVIAFSVIFSQNGILHAMGLNVEILYTLKAIIIAHIFYESPIFVKYISHALMSINPKVIEAAQLDGASTIKRLMSIDLRLILPSLLKAFFLVFTYSFMSFAVVLNLGGIQFSTLEVSIANALRGRFDFSEALFYAIFQFGILFILNYICSSLLKETYENEQPQRLNVRTSVFEKIITVSYCAFEYMMIFVGLSGIIFDWHDGRFSLTHLLNLFSDKINRKYDVVKSIVNSIGVAAITATVSTFLGYFLINLKTKLTDYVILPILGISSAFTAMALLYMNILYGVPYALLIVAGYILISVPLAYSFLFQNVRGFRNELLEASYMDGAGKIRAFVAIKLPILLPTFLAVFFQIFAVIYGEFTISYTMQIRDFFPLASVVNYSLSAHRYYLESQAFASLNTIIVFMMFWLSSLLLKERK
ncbi:MAG TPA: ABC transporter permease subunit [Thermotogota bacterium]|nr:ABC transporter permease subunit [Thermotogota bacterium]HPJ90013.1 ABC transporter permease subunit [Thermotogota bacterium]HPR96952.1 ABC transporter permease subunit [Thermotogota bacterium]